VAQPADTVADLTFVGMIAAADPVVQGIAAVLVLASVATWAIILEKLVRFAGLSREVGALERTLAEGRLPATDQPGLAATIAAAGVQELTEGVSPGESRSDIRARVERALRLATRRQLRRYESGLPLLATIGATTPFIGLLGTVWGIMHSFTAIAKSKDTSLAVVAPGIAEALFVTALGLFAAIPAVIAYNQIATSLTRAGERIAATSGTLATWLSRADLDRVRPIKGVK
jgi:biopolymer transport protein ExbB/TolQ